MTKVPSPFLLMKRSRRVLDFDDTGRPLHPLLNQGLPIKIAQEDVGTLQKWGANHASYILLSCKDAVCLVQENGTWQFPGRFLKAGETAESYVVKQVGGDVNPKKIYSNLDNFDSRATKHAWIEANIFKVSLSTQSSPSTIEGKWYTKDKLPKNLHGLHKILIIQNL